METRRGRLAQLIAALRLRPHPEGGYFRETYRAAGTIARTALPRRYPGPRRYATAILYLLPAGQRSRWHRIASDELWHFHLGGPLLIADLSPAGRARTVVLGPRIGRGQAIQHVIPAGHWFAAQPAPGTRYALVGCTVAPGFEFEDFEMADTAALRTRYPRHARLVDRFS